MVPTLAVFKRLMELLGSDTLTLNPGGRSMIVATLEFLATTIEIPNTTIFAPTETGIYRLSVFFASRNTFGSAIMGLNLAWQDDEGALAFEPLLSLDLSTVNVQYTVIPFLAGSANPIAFQVNLNSGSIDSGVYDVVLVLELLQ